MGILTLSQTTNFMLFQIDRVCRRQFQILWKWNKVLQMGIKHCGKRRNCSLRAISPFPCVFKRLLLQTRKKLSLFGKGLILSCYETCSSSSYCYENPNKSDISSNVSWPSPHKARANEELERYRPSESVVTRMHWSSAADVTLWRPERWVSGVLPLVWWPVIDE